MDCQNNLKEDSIIENACLASKVIKRWADMTVRSKSIYLGLTRCIFIYNFEDNVCQKCEWFAAVMWERESKLKVLTRSGERKVMLHRSVLCVLGEQFTARVTCVLNGEEISKSGWTLSQFEEKLLEATSPTDVRKRWSCLRWQGS